MVEHPEDYPWSSYRTMIGMQDDRITQTGRIHAYFGKKAVFRYRQFVEDIGHKYVVEENEIKRSRTSADLNESENIRFKDVKAVLKCRDLNQSNSKTVNT